MFKINKSTLCLQILFLSSFAFCQESEEKNEVEYDRWSVEFSIGQNKAIRPFSEGYYSSEPNTYFNFSEINHYDLGLRYMLSPVFGLKLDFAYDNVANQSGSGSLPFEVKQYRIGLQGVANVGRILKFEKFTKRIGLLAHAGIQAAILQPEFPNVNHNSEQNGGVIVGLTPQLKIANWLALTGDFTVLSNVRQHYTWDGAYSASDDNLSGLMYNTSLGLTFYLGKKKQHADWYIELEEDKKDKMLQDQEARKRLDDMETMLKDADKDGVPDYLDFENNTPSGVAVDTRGRFIDENKNGVPDEMERKNQNNNQISIGGDNSSYLALSNSNALKSLVENKSVNVYYDVNKDTPNSGSTNSVLQIYQYLKDNPDAKIKLVGYADVRGDESNNKNLSERRAKNLKSFLVQSGIAESRITIDGVGVDTSFPSTKTGYDLARRVSVFIN